MVVDACIPFSVKKFKNEKYKVGLVEEKGKKGRKGSDIILRSDSKKKITFFYKKEKELK